MKSDQGFIPKIGPFKHLRFKAQRFELVEDFSKKNQTKPYGLLGTLTVVSFSQTKNVKTC